ncbi:MAG TPA: adenosylmethionine--8-amino-7-oxononanoate transaminase [Desulfobacterales bacterium]|nr:adenosylmethionine--8-amino-7-oxononanoate transaminase [Desulfobacterales bacterium]
MPQIQPEAVLLDYDRRHVWHPYTSPTEPLPVYPVVAAHGVYLRLMDGRELIDGMSSWWCAIHGYNHPRLNTSLKEQAEKMAHVMFGGLTHEPAVSLARTLIDITPPNLQKVFFCDSGSVAVEVAMKMALQYQAALKLERRKHFLTIRGGYHGDTLGAMSVCDPVTGMHQLFSGALPVQFFAERPVSTNDEAWREDDIADFQTQLAGHHQEIAAVIMEPVVQGAGGMYFYAPEFLRRVRKLCDEYGVLLILDEIATGFGRTGRMFACEHAGVAPDIMCLGKALTGGYMSFAATLTTERVGEVIGRRDGVFMHGPTFMANPLACAVANASLDLLSEMDISTLIGGLASGLRRGLEPCRALPAVAEVRVLGAIGVVEMKKPVDVAALQREFVERGVWIRPFGRLVYIMPPYIITGAELDYLTSRMVEVIKTL